MTVFCVHLVIDQIQSGASGFVRQGRRHGPSIAYKITTCWVTFLQPARQAAVLGQHSSFRSHWARLFSTVLLLLQAKIEHSAHGTWRCVEDQDFLLSSRYLIFFKAGISKALTCHTGGNWELELGTGNCVRRGRGIGGCRKGSISKDSKTRSSLPFLLHDSKIFRIFAAVYALGFQRLVFWTMSASRKLLVQTTLRFLPGFGQLVFWTMPTVDRF